MTDDRKLSLPALYLPPSPRHPEVRALDLAAEGLPGEDMAQTMLRLVEENRRCAPAAKC